MSEGMFQQRSAKWSENLPEVLSEDQAIEAFRQLSSLREILTAPQRQQMADLALWWQEEHERRQDGYLRETARAISDTFRNVQALGPDVGSILRQVAKKRFEQARIAAEVPRKNWVAEYRAKQEQQRQAYSMDGYLEGLRAMRVQPNPYLPAGGVKQDIPEFWRRRG